MEHPDSSDSTLAALLKPLVYWRLPVWKNENSTAHLLKISASNIDVLSFIFEYLAEFIFKFTYLCLSGLDERVKVFAKALFFAFAMRRFSDVLEWGGIVVVVSMLVLRVPMLLAYFINVPNVLDYLRSTRVFMSGFIFGLLFGSNLPRPPQRNFARALPGPPPIAPA